MAETNQVKWRGIRPVLPAESIPIKKGAEERLATANTPATKVTVTSAGVTLLAANSARVSFLIRNTGSVDVYVRLGATPTTNDLTLEPGDIILGDDYSGIITGIVSSTSGEVRVMEV